MTAKNKNVILLGILLALNSLFTIECFGEGNKPNVILIVIDTLRAGHLGAYGYERDTTANIDAFARDNLRYEFAQATSPWTLPSVSGIITGFYPSVLGIFRPVPRHGTAKNFEKNKLMGVVLEEGFSTLPEIFSNAGYETVAICGNVILRPYLGFAQGYDRYVIREKDMLADEVNDALFEYLNSAQPGNKPLFLFLLYFDPHWPYEPPDKFDIYKDGLEVGEYKGELLKELNLYDGEIRYVDTKIGELFRELKKRNLYDNSIIIITSDHGEQFEEHGRMHHGSSVFNQEIHVPLIIKSQKMGKGVVQEAVSIIDIFPTVLDLVNLGPSVSTQGYSLYSELGRRKAAGVFVEGTLNTHEKAFMSDNGLKIRITFDGDNWKPVNRTQVKIVDIFNSKEDNLESIRIEDKATRSKVLSRFWRVYQDSLKIRGNRPFEMTELKDITLKQLQTLGYIK